MNNQLYFKCVFEMKWSSTHASRVLDNVCLEFVQPEGNTVVDSDE